MLQFYTVLFAVFKDSFNKQLVKFCMDLVTEYCTKISLLKLALSFSATFISLENFSRHSQFLFY